MTKSQSMKKLIIALAALTLLCAPAGAQGFLNKLKEKASEAVGSVVSGAIGEKIQDALPESLKGAASQAEAPTAVTGEQALPPRREKKACNFSANVYNKRTQGVIAQLVRAPR